MYLIREVFQTKPGKAKDLVRKFKQTVPYLEKHGMNAPKIMTDIATKYWTVVVEFEAPDLTDFSKEVRGGTPDPEVEKIMAGYLDLVDGGYREIFLIE